MSTLETLYDHPHLHGNRKKKQAGRCGQARAEINSRCYICMFFVAYRWTKKEWDEKIELRNYELLRKTRRYSIGENNFKST